MHFFSNVVAENITSQVSLIVKSTYYSVKKRKQTMFAKT